MVIAKPSKWFWICVGLLAGLSVGAAAHWVTPINEAFRQQIQAWRFGHLDARADAVMAAVTVFGSVPWTLLTTAGFASDAWRRRGWRAALTLVVAYVVGEAVKAALRWLVPYERPGMFNQHAVSPLQRVGFPSGHAYRAAWVFGLLACRASHPAMRALSWAAVGLVGFTRVYLDRHWLADVLGAWLLAAALVNLVGPLLRRASIGSAGQSLPQP